MSTDAPDSGISYRTHPDWPAATNMGQKVKLKAMKFGRSRIMFLRDINDAQRAWFRTRCVCAGACSGLLAFLLAHSRGQVPVLTFFCLGARPRGEQDRVGSKT